MRLTAVQRRVLEEMTSLETWGSSRARSGRRAFYRRSDGTAVPVLPATVQVLVRAGYLTAVESNERRVVYRRSALAPS